MRELQKRGEMTEILCAVEGCSRPKVRRLWCGMHYMRWQRHGDPLGKKLPAFTPEERFWQKVSKSPTGCWEWTGARSNTGYGSFRYRGHAVNAHRMVLHLIGSDVPEGMVVDHKCANRACVNPNHLRVVTYAQNSEHRAVLSSTNKVSGVRGVYFAKGKWAAQISRGNKTIYLGRYADLSEAEEVVKQARAVAYTHDDHEQWRRLRDGRKGNATRRETA